MTTPQPAALPESATVLPDGSAFAIASFPLPADHWLYAPREYRDGEDDPIELPAPILNHRDHGDAVRAAIRYAVRSATMCGKEEDFDPDALVQNAMYALCGPFGAAALQSQPAAAGVSDAEIASIARQHWPDATDYGFATHIAFARAILPLRPQAVRMTERWRLLNTGERIESGDECLQDDCVTWEPLVGWEVGMTYNPHVLVPLRRRIEAHHGITAPAGGEG